MARRRSSYHRSRRSRRGSSPSRFVGCVLAAVVVAVLVGALLTHVTSLDEGSVRMLSMLAAGISLGRGWPR